MNYKQSLLSVRAYAFTYTASLRCWCKNDVSPHPLRLSCSFGEQKLVCQRERRSEEREKNLGLIRCQRQSTKSLLELSISPVNAFNVFDIYSFLLPPSPACCSAEDGEVFIYSKTIRCTRRIAWRNHSAAAYMHIHKPHTSDIDKGVCKMPGVQKFRFVLRLLEIWCLIKLRLKYNYLQ